MISVSPARRRAEEFAALVDGRSGDGDARFSDLLPLVGVLQSVPQPQARPEFVADLRAQLMVAADEALVAVDGRLALPARPSRHHRRVAVAASAFALVGITSSVAVAAQNALPGDALYPIKRVIESAETSLQPDDAARAEQILDNASGRLAEAEALALRDSAESQAAMPDTLDDFVTQANQAADILIQAYDESGEVEHILELRDFTADSLHLLAALKPTLPTALLDELAATVNELLAIDARALEACPDCGGLLELPIALVSGGQVPVLPLGPTVGPRSTLEAAPPPASPDVDAVTDLIHKLPVVGSPTSPPPTGTTGDEPQPPPTGSRQPPLDPTEPLSPVTDPLVGDEGLLTGEDALGQLLNPLLHPVTKGPLL